MQGDLDFPEGFVFGTATSAHQVEGDNRFNDWWEWEERGRVPRSGRACGHWQLYKEDIELMAKLGYRGYRFSVEWSRLYPQEGVFNEEALERYSEIVELLRSKGIEPIVTLHHFTNPAWFNRRGSWLREDNVNYFLDFVSKVADTLRGVRYWVVFNEPNVYVLQGFVWGAWPPGYKGLGKGRRALEVLVKAYAGAYEILKRRGVMVGVAQNIVPFKPARSEGRDVGKARLLDLSFNWSFIDGVLEGKFTFLGGTGKGVASDLDYVGVNYYTAYEVRHTWNPLKRFIDARPLKTDMKTTMGYYVYPRGIYEAVKAAARRSRRHVVVTENGVAVEDDENRIRAIIRHLQYLHKALREGVDVRGYYYWSFMDNYEWDKGFTQRFGLVEVDYETLARKPRKSAYIYGEIARTNRVGRELLEKYGLKQVE